MNAYDLTGKVALVTGGSGGLGKGIARALGECGARVVLGDIKAEAVRAAAAELAGASLETIPLVLDVTSAASIDAALDEIAASIGLPTILVNNAGVTRMQDLHEISDEQWAQVFAVNVTGVFRCSERFAARLQQAGRPGSIVNIASNAGKVCFPGQAHYNASKAAVINLTQSLALELAAAGINVNAVCPGGVDTEMLRYCMLETIARIPDNPPGIDELRRTWGPPQLGRLVQPVEVGRIVAFLASDAAILIRGQAINVDAGVTRQ